MTYALPISWEQPIAQWMVWLRAGGARPETIKVRRGHVRMIARRSNTTHPNQLTPSQLVGLCGGQRWSAEHRRGVRSSLLSFYRWACENELVNVNPALSLPKVSHPAPRPRPGPPTRFGNRYSPPRRRAKC